MCNNLEPRFDDDRYVSFVVRIPTSEQAMKALYKLFEDTEPNGFHIGGNVNV